MHRLRYAIFGTVLVLPGCSEVANIEAIPCQPACKDATTRIVCDAAGNARTEECPPSKEECAVPACEAGTCTFKPAIGAPCGETEGAQCNEGFACIGGRYYLSTVFRHTCFAAEDGKVWCWGDNTYGQLGDGTDRPGLHPVLVRGLPGPAATVNAGYDNTCASLRSGEVYCWGNNQDGQCGVPRSEPISAPVHVPVPGIQFIAVGPGEKHTCALAEDRTVYCWGNTEYGQCGSDPTLTGPRLVAPMQVPDLDKVSLINMVKDHNCAVRSEAPYLKCWGSNSHVQPPERPHVNGKLGPAAGELPFSAAPIPVDVGSPITSVSMGAEATYALSQDGRVHAWGGNDRLQLGVESEEKIVRSPALVMTDSASGLVPLAGVADLVRSRGPDNCVRMSQRQEFGVFVCWGTDDWGELGAGTAEDARTTHRYPLPVRALPPIVSLLVRGEDHTCAAVIVDRRTEIQCYGRPGLLGNGTPRAEDGDPPSHWEGTPVVWDPANFAPALSE